MEGRVSSKKKSHGTLRQLAHHGGHEEKEEEGNVPVDLTSRSVVAPMFAEREEDKISKLELDIQGYVSQLEAASISEEGKDIFFQLITSSRNILKVLKAERTHYSLPVFSVNYYDMPLVNCFDVSETTYSLQAAAEGNARTRLFKN